MNLFPYSANLKVLIKLLLLLLWSTGRYRFLLSFYSEQDPAILIQQRYEFSPWLVSTGDICSRRLSEIPAHCSGKTMASSELYVLYIFIYIFFVCVSRGRPSSKTVKHKKIPEGSHQHELMKYASRTLGSGNIKQAVQLPEGEDLNEWIAVNSE